MLGQIELMPEQASVVAGEVDALFYFLCAVTGFFTLLIAVLIVYFAVKYRRRPGDGVPRPVYGSYRLEVAWSILPAVIGLVIFGWGVGAYFSLARPPDDSLEINVVARQWMWKLWHPDGQGEINELHVPVGQPVRLNMISEDVIHSFYVPAFRMKQDVLPGRYTTTWFEATRPGRYRLFCTEYCGTEHSKMIGWVVVQEPADYQTWLSGQADGGAAREGAKLFRSLKCITCHGRGGENLAPLLEDIYGRPVRLDDGSEVPIDRNYLRESILDPRTKVVAGYRPIMPTYKGQVGEEKILQLVAFIRSLGRGDTPPRVERTPPPLDESGTPGGTNP